MYTNRPGGRAAPPRSHVHLFDDPIRIDEARLSAWALSIGEVRPGRQSGGRRPHRGQLADVDLSLAVPVRRGPSRLARIARAIATFCRDLASRRIQQGGRAV